MQRAVSIDAGRVFRRLDAGPATVAELAVECGADLRTVWGFVRHFEARGLVHRMALAPKQDLPRIAKYPDCNAAVKCCRNERGAGCFQHTDASNHSPNARRFEDG